MEEVTLEEIAIITKAKVDKTSIAKQKEYSIKGFKIYGLCCGYEREEHLFFDNVFHYAKSHGICKPCSENYLNNE